VRTTAHFPFEARLTVRNLSLPVYPETCNVPLEEMNTLFGDEGFDDENSDDEDNGSDDGDLSPSHSETTSLRAPSPDRNRGGWLGWARRHTGRPKVGGEDGYKAVDQPSSAGDS
jgi:hypothetical protein